MENPRPLFKQSAETICILALMREAKVGATITYESMRKAIGYPVTDERMRRAIGSAMRILLRDAGMVFTSVPKVGYQRLTQPATLDNSDRDALSLRRSAHRATMRLATIDPKNIPAEKQAKLASRMAVFAVVSGCFDHARVRKLESTTGVEITERTLRTNMRNVLDALGDGASGA